MSYGYYYERESPERSYERNLCMALPYLAVCCFLFRICGKYIIHPGTGPWDITWLGLGTLLMAGLLVTFFDYLWSFGDMDIDAHPFLSEIPLLLVGVSSLVVWLTLHPVGLAQMTVAVVVGAVISGFRVWCFAILYVITCFACLAIILGFAAIVLGGVIWAIVR